MSRRRAFPLVAIAFLGLAPAAAEAANVRIVTTSMGARTLYFDAAPGEANRVTMTQSSTAVVVRDTAGGLGSSDGSCTGVGATEKTCPIPGGFILREAIVVLGNLDDEFTATLSARVEVSGRDGRDIMRGTPFDDQLSGGHGNDDAFGFAGDDVLDDEDSTTFDDDGNDLQDGGAGDDELYGLEGDDALLGGEGQDELWVANGVETTNGGPGIDTLAADPRGGGAPPEFDDGVLFSLDGQANDGIRTSPERWSIGPGIEDLQGSFKDDVLSGDGSVNRIEARSGADQINPGAGPDTVDAGDDGDTIFADDLFVDRVLCGAGADTARLDTADQHVDCESPTLVPPPEPPAPPRQPPAVLDTTSPLVSIRMPSRGARLKDLRRGRVPALRLTSNEPITGSVRLTARPKSLRLARSGDVELAETRMTRPAGGARTIRLKIPRKLARRIGRRTRLRVELTAVDGGGNLARRAYALKVRR